MLGCTVSSIFGGHTIPVSTSIFKILAATGIVSQQEADKQQTPGLDRAVPKTKGVEFASCLHQLAADLRVQPGNKNLKAILKEAGAVDQPKRPVTPPPERKTEKKESTSSKMILSFKFKDKAIKQSLNMQCNKNNKVIEMK